MNKQKAYTRTSLHVFVLIYLCNHLLGSSNRVRSTIHYSTIKITIKYTLSI